jgi:hypothetical protein
MYLRMVQDWCNRMHLSISLVKIKIIHFTRKKDLMGLMDVLGEGGEIFIFPQKSDTLELCWTKD